MKNYKQLIIAIVVAICSAIVAFFTSCSTAEHYTRSEGHTSIITSDTTNIWHGGNLTIKIK